MFIKFSGQLGYADGFKGGLIENEQSRGVSIYSSLAEAESFVVRLPVQTRDPRQTHSTKFGLGGEFSGGTASSSSDIGFEDVPRSFV